MTADTLPAFPSLVYEQARLAYGAYRLAVGSEGCFAWEDLTEAEACGWAAFADVCLRNPHESPHVLAVLGNNASAARLRRVLWADLDPARQSALRAAAAALLASYAALRNKSEP